VEESQMRRIDLPEAAVTREWYALTPRKRNNVGSDAKTS
jgi:hypothetical protein